MQKENRYQRSMSKHVAVWVPVSILWKFKTSLHRQVQMRRNNELLRMTKAGSPSVRSGSWCFLKGSLSVWIFESVFVCCLWFKTHIARSLCVSVCVFAVGLSMLTDLCSTDVLLTSKHYTCWWITQICWSLSSFTFRKCRFLVLHEENTSSTHAKLQPCDKTNQLYKLMLIVKVSSSTLGFVSYDLYERKYSCVLFHSQNKGQSTDYSLQAGKKQYVHVMENTDQESRTCNSKQCLAGLYITGLWQTKLALNAHK